MKKSELFFTFILLPVDILMIALGFIVSYFWRANQDLVIYMWPFMDYLKFIAYSMPFWILIFALQGLYSSKNGHSGFEIIAKIFLAVSTGIMLIVAWLFLSRTMFFSRLVVIYAWFLILIFVAIGRLLIHLIQKYLYRYGIGVHRVIYIGLNHITYNSIRVMQQNRSWGYKVLGALDDLIYKKKIDQAVKNHIKVLGKIDDIEVILKKHPTDEIILTEPNLSESKVAELIEFCEEKNIVFSQTPNLFEVKASNTVLDTLAGVPILKFRRTPLEGWGKILKRIMDMIGSVLALVILSPVFLAAAIGVKLSSPGPILFRQQRVGEDGKLFTFLKFRSMRSGADKKHEEYIKKYGNMFKLKNDPRVTKFGRFIRKTSIDELPQFWNVLIGDMSLVGPRPPMIEEVKRYTRWQRKRLMIKPGLTGMWQVSGRSDVDFDDWVRLDLYYIQNWSLLLDIKILFKTVGVLFTRKGAY